ncbi:MAG: hypothetical protein UH542_01055 [Bacteroidales bacterium]|nr:hypothetical protein [Bacteroidales bacterium]
MLKLLVGPKGSGKTIRIINEIKSLSGEKENNCVVYVTLNPLESGTISTRDVRNVVVNKEIISSYNSLYGFLTGLVAGNYDTEYIALDSVLKIGGPNMEELLNFIKRISESELFRHINVVLSISCEKKDLLPEFASFAAIEYL